MKNLLILVLAIFLCTGSLMSQLRLGVGSNLIFETTVFGLQGKLLYEQEDQAWRGVGSFTYHLDNFFDWSIDLDTHYRLLDVGEDFNLAPFAGLSYIKSNLDKDLGFNLGAFIELFISERNIYIEPKVIFRDGSKLAISGGIIF